MKIEDEADNSRAQNCHIEPFLKFIAQEWMSHIIWALARNETLRFGQLRRSIPAPISARVLSARLKELEQAGYVSRLDLSGTIRRVEYSLTAAGSALDEALRRGEKLVSAFNPGDPAPTA